jgi:hypothetical protein
MRSKAQEMNVKKSQGAERLVLRMVEAAGALGKLTILRR